MKKGSRISWPLRYLVLCLLAMLMFISLVSYTVVLLRAPSSSSKSVDVVDPASAVSGVDIVAPRNNIDVLVGRGRAEDVTTRDKKRDSILKGLHDPNDESHFLLLDSPANGGIICPSASTEIGNALPGIPVIENTPAVFSIDATHSKAYNAQLCFTHHVHPHSIELRIQNLDKELTSNHCNMFISLQYPNPSRQRFDFKADKQSTSNSITLHTYMEDFVRSNSNTLYLSVQAGTEGDIKCELSVKVSPVSFDELIKISPLLRGGVLASKRDMMRLING